MPYLRKLKGVEHVPVPVSHKRLIDSGTLLAD